MKEDDHKDRHARQPENNVAEHRTTPLSSGGAAAIADHEPCWNTPVAVLPAPDHRDFGQALIALDGDVEVVGPSGRRSLPFGQLHTEPGENRHVETSLTDGEVIRAFIVPAGAWTRRSTYVKVLDRESYEFALASAAMALELDGDKVREVSIGLGGVATIPWRAREAEAVLLGKPLNEANASAAAEAAFARARPREHNALTSLTPALHAAS